MSDKPIRFTAWGEYRNEHVSKAVAELYPDGIHLAISSAVKSLLLDQVQVRTAALDNPEHGLTEQVLAETDVLSWWGHGAHGEVSDAVVSRVHDRVLEGMGLFVLHFSHYSKIFKKLMGTDCGLRWREAAEREIIWCSISGPDTRHSLTTTTRMSSASWPTRSNGPPRHQHRHIRWGGQKHHSTTGADCLQARSGRASALRMGDERDAKISRQSDLRSVLISAIRKTSTLALA